MKKLLILTLLTLFTFAAYAQGGIKGQVVSRNGRTAVGLVKVTIDATGQTVTTDDNGCSRSSKYARPTNCNHRTFIPA